MTRLIDFADGFETDTTPIITDTIEITNATIDDAQINALELPNLDQDEFITVDVNGEVISSGYDVNYFDDQIAEKINPNIIINGNFDFWQRYTSGSGDGYAGDRWRTLDSGSTITFSRQATTRSEGFNATYFCRNVVSSSAGAANFAAISQRIEGVGFYGGKTLTLSFWAKADSNKNIALEMRQDFGSTGSTGVDGIDSQLIALTSSWQKFTVTVNIPSVSGKTISGGGDYLSLFFWLDAGSSFSSRAAGLGQQSGTFDFAQVKLEEGSLSTPFCLSGGTIAGELVSCQRFYEKSWADEVTVGTSTSASMQPVQAASTTILLGFRFAVPKRMAPAVVIYGRTGTIDKVGLLNGSTDVTGSVSTLSATNVAVTTITLDTASFTANSTYRIHFTVSAEL